MFGEQKIKRAVDACAQYMAAVAFAEEGMSEVAQEFLGRSSSKELSQRRHPPFPPTYWPLLVTP